MPQKTSKDRGILRVCKEVFRVLWVIWLYKGHDFEVFYVFGVKMPFGHIRHVSFVFVVICFCIFSLHCKVTSCRLSIAFVTEATGSN